MKLKSFTLIELVTVVSIVGVLSGIMVYGVNDWKDKAYMDEVAAYSNNIKNKIGGTLVAEWKMEGIETALLYDSGRLGITGTTGGTLTKVNNCPEGNNCINSNVANVSFSNSQKFSTVCFWIKPTATSVDILERTNDFKIYTTSGIVSFNIYYADATYNTVTYTGKNIYDNKWHYVCGSLNSDETFVGTIDGDVFASETVNVDSFNRGSSMCLGCSANSLFYMDDLVLFAGSLEKGLLVSTTVINGTCGAAARTYITETDYDGLESFCETGNVSSFPSFPDLGSSVSWSCLGINGGTTATCTATKAISGVCGSSDGANLTSIPTENLCSAGTASSVSGTGPWTWSCLGINGGTTDSCATGTMPVNGVCGSSDGEGFYSTPTENLCSAGMASSVSGTGPWTWECVGLYGGTTDSCSATFLKGDQATPAAPTLSSKTSTTVILSSCTGCEYRRDGGTWQSSNTFSGLSPLTTYSFTQRLAETETLNASPESAILSVTTDWACGLAFVDPRDGQSYTTKQYGSKCWMTQNLNYASTYGICYSNNATYCLSAGRLYNAGIYAGLTSICPTGWHTPNLQDWVNLDTIYSTTYCFADATLSCVPAGTALKTGGVSGFEAPLSGYYYSTAFGGWGTYGAYLAYYDGYTSGYHFLYSTSTGVVMGTLGAASSNYYLSVRCVKD